MRRALAAGPRGYLWLPALLSLAVHGTYVANGFTWIDHFDIEQGHAVVPLSQLPGLFLARYGETTFYRPLVALLHSLDAATGGGRPWVFHLTNVVLGAAVAAVAGPFARTLLRVGRAEALVVGLVVAVHPLSWLPVGQISFRPDLLVSLFVMLGVVAHARARRERRVRWVLATAASFAAALSSKETAIVWLPALVGLWELGFRLERAHAVERGTSAPGEQVPTDVTVKLLAAEALVIGTWALLRFAAVPHVWTVDAAPFHGGEALGTRLALLARRFADLLRPAIAPLSDATKLVGALDPWALAGALGTAVGAIVAFRMGLRSRWTKALVVLGIALGPALDLVPLPRLNSPHYAYFAVVPLGMLAALGLQALRRRWQPHSRKLTWAGASLLAALGVVTASGGGRQANDIALFGPEVAADPAFREGLAYLGAARADRGDDEGAARALAAALRDRPGIVAYVDRVSVQINLAGVRLRQHRLDDAEALLAAAATGAAPYRRARIAYNRALIALDRGDYARIAVLLEPTWRSWNRPEPLLLYARALAHVGHPRRAAQVLQRAVPMLESPRREQIAHLARNLATR